MKIQIKFLALVVVGLMTTSALAEAPAGYYNGLSGLKDAELKTAVSKLARNFTRSGSYGTIYSNLKYTFQKTDLYPNSERWWDMYSDQTFYAPSFRGLNREHSFPKSWWGGATDIPPYVDLNHLYPSEIKANSAKLHYPLGEVGPNPDFDNGVSKVGYPVAGQGGGAKYVFEPADEYKGDFARTYFYMATIYQDLTWKHTYMVSSNTYPTLNTWSINLLLRWHRQDPVSEKETRRNDAVYSVQNNRNPFIDHPELAEYIWGNKKGLLYNPGSTEPAGDPVLTTPVQDMTLDFGRVALGKSATARLLFKGENLTSAVKVQKYTGNAEMFTLAATQIPAALIVTEEGYWLNVTYTPTEIGKHTTRLLISGGGVSGSRGVALTAECCPVPTLSQIHATEATDVTQDQYVANWDAPAGEEVDYYIVTRTIYRNGTAKTEELVAEENSLVITGFSESDSETYSVRSSYLGYESTPSNVIVVKHDGISDATVDAPLAVAETPGGIRLICDRDIVGLRIYNVSGKLAVAGERAVNNTEIMLPSGVYFVIAGNGGRPIKVVVR